MDPRPSRRPQRNGKRGGKAVSGVNVKVLSHMGGNVENIGAEAWVKDLVRRKAWDIGGIACFRPGWTVYRISF
jgi:hypothetical protein